MEKIHTVTIVANNIVVPSASERKTAFVAGEWMRLYGFARSTAFERCSIRGFAKARPRLEL